MQFRTTTISTKTRMKFNSCCNCCPCFPLFKRRALPLFDYDEIDDLEFIGLTSTRPFTAPARATIWSKMASLFSRGPGHGHSNDGGENSRYHSHYSAIPTFDLNRSHISNRSPRLGDFDNSILIDIEPSAEAFNQESIARMTARLDDTSQPITATNAQPQQIPEPSESHLETPTLSRMVLYTLLILDEKGSQCIKRCFI